MAPLRHRVTLEIADSRDWPEDAIGARIFEPYAAWPASRRHSGLELAVAWCILQQRGAEVSIGRSRGMTAVRITFGAHPQQPAAQAPAAEATRRNSFRAWLTGGDAKAAIVRSNDMSSQRSMTV
jgi:hypothetical protein